MSNVFRCVSVGNALLLVYHNHNGCVLQGYYQMAQILSSTTAISNWSPDLVAGPEWRSFEQFRVAGSAALESIASGCVATLQVKSKTFRILRDDDFQKLAGLASEVHRLRQGITIVVQAAKIVAKHPDDRDGFKLLWQSAS